MTFDDRPCKTCGETEYHRNHFAFFSNIPITGGHCYEPVEMGAPGKDGQK